MKENKPSLLTSIWFSLTMSLVALFFFADYTRLVLSGDDSVRRIFALVAWFIIALVSIYRTVRGYRKQRQTVS